MTCIHPNRDVITETYRVNINILIIICAFQSRHKVVASMPLAAQVGSSHYYLLL